MSGWIAGIGGECKKVVAIFVESDRDMVVRARYSR